MRNARYAALFACLLTTTVHLFATECSKTLPPKEGITLNGTTGHAVTYEFANPAKKADTSNDPAKQAEPVPTIKDFTFCWLSEEEMQAGKTCAQATGLAPSPTIAVGRCTQKGTGADATTTIDYPQFGSAGTVFSEAKSLIVSYTPGTTSKEDPRYLRLEWKAKTGEVEKPDLRVYRVSFLSSPPDLALDPRFKLWLYTGYAFLYSKKDFADSFAEIRLHSESRWADGLQRIKARNQAGYAQLMRDGSRDPSIGWTDLLTFRSYGEVGLSSTSATTVADANAQASPKARRAFDIGYGLGFGKTWVVAVENPDINTNAFSTLLVARASHVSIPGQDEVKDGNTVVTPATKSVIRFRSAFGVRVENETGHFKGSYGEVAWGESSDFELQKSSRAKFDGYLPFNDPGLLRVAARLQVDIPSVFAKLNPDRGTTPAEKSASHEAIRAGDVKITILFNIDVRDLFHRLGAPAEPTK